MDDAEWKSRLCASAFFGPCRIHSFEAKNECTYFCLDAPFAPPLCAHCVPLVNPGLRLMQIRRYMYRNVVNSDDISKHMDASGVQTYTVNGNGVVFIQPKAGASVQITCICRCCQKAIRPGATHCSIMCKALSGDARPVSYRKRPRKQTRPTRSIH